MKSFRNNAKRLLYLCLVMLLCCSMMSITASATEQTEQVATHGSIESRGAGQGHVIYPQSTTVTISGGEVDYVSYTGTYGLFGSEGVIGLRFTNVNTGDHRSYTFICDNSYYSYRDLPKSLPAGTYTITCDANTVKNFNNISISFG